MIARLYRTFAAWLFVAEFLRVRKRTAWDVTVGRPPWWVRA